MLGNGGQSREHTYMKNKSSQNPIRYFQSNGASGFSAIILAIIAGLFVAGIVAGYQYVWLPRQESTPIKLPLAEEKEKVTSLSSTPMPTTDNTQESTSSREKFVYLKSLTDNVQGAGEIIISNFDGSSKTKLQTVPKYVGPLDDHDIAPENGRIVYTTSVEKTGGGFEETLWISDKGAEPKKILTLIKNKSIESPKISLDGTKIAYSLINWGNNNYSQQLWTINADGSDNKIIADNTKQYIIDQGPFRLVPVAWSKDKTKVYLITTSDSEATPVGMYVADLLTGKIVKAQTPQVTLWGLSFSTDRKKIAYTTFQWKYVPDSKPKPGAPFTLNITDLSNGATIKILESQNDEYANPVWSNDGKMIAYKIVRGSFEGGNVGIFFVDVNSKTTTLVATGTRNSILTPWSWIGSNRIVYTEEAYSEGAFSIGQIGNKVTTYLFTIKADKTDKQKIDSARDMIVFGSL